MKKKILEKFFVFSVILMLCFLLLEIGLRTTGRRSFKISEGEHAQHGSSYRLKKNSTTFHDWSSSTFTVNTNSLGLRDRTVYLYVPICDSFTIREVVTQLGKDPDDYDISIYERFMEDYFTRHGHMFIIPKSVLKEYYDEGEQLDLGRDPHYNEFSNRLVGEYIIEKVFIENELF